MRRWTAARSPTIGRRTPRRSRRRVGAEEKPSTASGHGPEVGVEREVRRGCRASRAGTFGCSRAPWSSVIAWTGLPAGTAASAAPRERTSSRWRRPRRPGTGRAGPFGARGRAGRRGGGGRVGGREQGGRAVALVVAGHRPALAGPGRQARPGAVGGLDPAPLAGRGHDRPPRPRP